jgi:hypothetical protein
MSFRQFELPIRITPKPPSPCPESNQFACLDARVYRRAINRTTPQPLAHNSKSCLLTHSCLDSWAIYTYHVVSLHRSKRRDLLWRRPRCRETTEAVVQGGIVEAVPRALLLHVRCGSLVLGQAAKAVPHLLLLWPYLRGRGRSREGIGAMLNVHRRWRRTRSSPGCVFGHTTHGGGHRGGHRRGCACGY